MSGYKSYDEMTDAERQASFDGQRARWEELEHASRVEILTLIERYYGSRTGTEGVADICLIGSILDKEFPERLPSLPHGWLDYRNEEPVHVHVHEPIIGTVVEMWLSRRTDATKCTQNIRYIAALLDPADPTPRELEPVGSRAEAQQAASERYPHRPIEWVSYDAFVANLTRILNR